MNPLLQYLLVERAKNKLGKNNENAKITKRQLVKEVRSSQVELAHTVKEILFIAIGVFAAGFGLKGFLLPNDFIDGGATGVSLLIRVKSNIPLGILLILVNFPFLLLGAKTIGKKFAIKSSARI